MAVGLRNFDSCDSVLDYYIENALERVGAYGLEGTDPYRGFPTEIDNAVLKDSAVSSASVSSRTEPSFSSTNVQVAGVDEADLVKTDGRFIYSVMDSPNLLRIVEANNGVLTMSSSLDVGFQPSEMLLHEDMLLLVAAEWRVGPVTRIAQVNISDRAAPEVVADLSVDGVYNGARLSGGTARFVITSNPVGIEWEYPSGNGLRAEQDAIEANRELVRNSTLGNWLPAYVLNTADRENAEWGQLVDCFNVLAPEIFSGLNTLSIVVFDLSSSIEKWSASSVVAEGDIVYATADSVYVSTSRWVDWAAVSDNDMRSESATHSTLIHKFDTASTSRPVYEASGQVPGFLLNQFSMDEYEGDLRVAVTASPSWWWSDESESHVTVLRPRGNLLEEIGSVGGLGEGERIFSVRFMGPDAYVVTFRQVDPLYALDLSDPSNPEVLGQLKIPGFSSYLHPVGDDLLLGVGQDASLEGRVEGLQVSLFDVSDPTNPVRVAQLRPLEGDGGEPNYSGSWVENDHRAFVFYDGLALIPYWSYWWDNPDFPNDTDTGVAVIEVKRSDLSLEALLRPLSDGPAGGNPPNIANPERVVAQRVIVIDGWIYSVTPSGIAAHQMNTWEWGMFLEYPAG